MSRKYYYDRKSDSLLIVLKEGEEESFEEVAPGINLELGKKKEIIGVEILQASRFFKEKRKVIGKATFSSAHRRRLKIR